MSAESTTSTMDPRSDPWKVRTRSPGVNWAACRAQVSTRVTGHTTRVGPGWSAATQVSTCSVLPSPMSSARTPPTSLSASHDSHWNPRSWYGRSWARTPTGGASCRAGRRPRGSTSAASNSTPSNASSVSRSAALTCRAALRASSPSRRASSASRRTQRPRTDTSSDLAAARVARSSAVRGSPSTLTSALRPKASIRSVPAPVPTDRIRRPTDARRSSPPGASTSKPPATRRSARSTSASTSVASSAALAPPATSSSQSGRPEPHARPSISASTSRQAHHASGSAPKVLGAAVARGSRVVASARWTAIAVTCHRGPHTRPGPSDGSSTRLADPEPSRGTSGSSAPHRPICDDPSSALEPCAAPICSSDSGGSSRNARRAPTPARATTCRAQRSAAERPAPAPVLASSPSDSPCARPAPTRAVTTSSKKRATLPAGSSATTTPASTQARRARSARARPSGSRTARHAHPSPDGVGTTGPSAARIASATSPSTATARPVAPRDPAIPASASPSPGVTATGHTRPGAIPPATGIETTSPTPWPATVVTSPGSLSSRSNDAREPVLTTSRASR